MEKKDCIEVFNAMIKQTPISFYEKIVPLILEYLTEINYEKINEMIYLIRENPQMINRFLPEMMEYYCKKFNIFKLMQKDKFNNFKVIMYYE